MEHELKILEKYARLYLTNKKWWELRKFDRDFKVGDTIKFIMIDDETNIPTGQHYVRDIEYIFEGGKYGLEKGYCILSIG